MRHKKELDNLKELHQKDSEEKTDSMSRKEKSLTEEYERKK